MSGGNTSGSPTEYSIKVPKNVNKKFHVMRFNADLNIDFTKWSQVKMERENNMKEYKMPNDDMPKFGAGSEFGREAKEEARRKKYGIITKKYRPDDQPWILKCGGKTGKKFKGIRGGGVSDNAAYYVFTHGPDGGIEAYPLNEWYHFHPIQRYKALSAEEAEQEFGRRNKVMNYFNLMLKKRLKNDDEIEGEEGDEGKPKKSKKKASSEFKISEMDEWLESGDEDSEGGDEENGELKEKKKPKAKAKPRAKKKKKGSDESASEESDDGDEEGRELDYISDSSESESDSEQKVVKDLKGVAEESALRGLLTSEEEDEEEENKNKNNEEKEGDNKDGQEKSKDRKRKHTKNKTDKKDDDDSSSDSSGDSSESDSEKTKPQSNGLASGELSKDDKKDDKTVAVAKKPKLDIPPTPLSYSGADTGITEEAVRRYLMRKPMTTTELLQKFKSRKTSMSSEQLVNVMTQILKRINPTKQMVKGKMYLSIKAPQQQ